MTILQGYNNVRTTIFRIVIQSSDGTRSQDIKEVHDLLVSKTNIPIERTAYKQSEYFCGFLAVASKHDKLVASHLNANDVFFLSHRV